MAGRNKQLTLVFVLDESQILLGLKKRGFGCGRWNGFGGKVENGETIVEAAKRELNEECGLTAQNLMKVAVIEFEFLNSYPMLEVHVFKTHSYLGEPVETEVMLGMGTEPLSKISASYVEYMQQFNLLNKGYIKPVILGEMRPRWFQFAEIPYDLMWPDDQLWYPYLLNNKTFKAYFKFDGLDTILEQKITEQTLT